MEELGQSSHLRLWIKLELCFRIIFTSSPGGLAFKFNVFRLYSICCQQYFSSRSNPAPFLELVPRWHCYYPLQYFIPFILKLIIIFYLLWRSAWLYLLCSSYFNLMTTRQLHKISMRAGLFSCSYLGKPIFRIIISKLIQNLKLTLNTWFECQDLALYKRHMYIVELLRYEENL